jgi:hypothetical protein
MNPIDMKRFLIIGVLLSCMMVQIKAQNLLNLDGWKVGTGSIAGFTANGSDLENNREWGEGPNGKRVVLWKATPDGQGGPDGGWMGFYFNVDHASMYRFTVWLKKTNSKEGYSYLGCNLVSDLNNVPNDNPYFFYGELPELDKWYLLVGFIHGSGDPSTVNYGGMYDGTTGIKVKSFTDFKFAPGTTTSYHRSYLFYDPNVNDRQYFYAPRVDLVNGNEPSIENLLGTSSANSGYFPGKVGIQTTNPGNYELAVNGKIRAKEVRVEAAWSDFVFEKDYPLLPLKDVATFIEKNKHLPDVPSEAEIQKNGVELGKVHSKLLQKIEELTLYIIKQEQRIDDLEKGKRNQKGLKK